MAATTVTPSSSDLPPLYPIVMRPLSEPPFECSGNGLLHQGHSRASISDLRSSLFPKRKNTTPLSRPKAWWQAQLLLYGLLPAPKRSETISTLRARLEAAVLAGTCDTFPRQLQEMEARLNHAFLHANARVRKENLLQSGGTEDEAMAVENPKLFLEQKFLNVASSSKVHGSKQEDNVHVCVLKRLGNASRAALHNAASALGLHTQSTDAPGGRYDRWLVVGRDKEAVWSEERKINAETVRLREQERVAKQQKLEDEHAQYVLRKLNSSVSKRAGEEGTTKWTDTPKDDPLAIVKGKWHITCEEIDKQWPGSQPLSLYLYRENDPFDNNDDDDDEGAGDDGQGSDADQNYSSDFDSDADGHHRGPGRLMGKFDFRVVDGLMKFSKQSIDSSTELKKNEKKRKREKEQEKKLGFQWRGIESGTGEVLYNPYGDQKGWITFHGPALAKLTGSIAWLGKMTFSGFKLSDMVPANVRDDWDNYDASAYEHARVSRWH